MRNMLRTLFVVALLAFAAQQSNACEIRLNVGGAAKQIYQTGDIVLVKITVLLEHRNCPLSLDETSIKTSGSQIIAATKWVNAGGRTWERIIRIKILENVGKKALITAERICEKDGGKGSLTLATK